MDDVVHPESFRAYAFYSSLLVGKVLAMSFLTSRQRFAKKAYANVEDTKLSNGKVDLADQDVERVRRAHQNDLENILPFFLIGALYLTTKPSPTLALNLFRCYAGSRFYHSFVYLFQVPQPSRALAFFVGMLINVFMICCVFCYYT